MTLPTTVVPIGVSCEMIVEKDGKILMGKRGNVFGRGSWALPGGHLEVGEKTVDCVRRELEEEAGIKPLDFKLLGVINDIPDIAGQARHYVRFVYLITQFTGEIVNREPERCEGWQWKEKNRLPEPLFVGHIKALRLYRSGKSFLYE